MPHFGSILDLVVIASTFGLALSLWLGAVLYWAHRRKARTQKVEYRLGLNDTLPGKTRVLRLWRDGQEVTTTIHERIGQLRVMARLRQMYWDSGLKAPMQTVVLGTLAGVVTVVMIMMLASGNLILSSLMALCVPAVVWMFVNHRISRRMVIFEMQFVDALGLAARSLRAGHPLIGAFRLISEEIGVPVGTLFGEIVQQQMLGLSFEQAMENSATASSSGDLRLFATSVLIQLRSGGNLADMMDRLAAVIRDRMRLNRHVRVLTAQTQFSKRVLLALPLVLFFLLSMINPQYMQPLYTTTLGKVLIIVGLCIWVAGAWIMNRLAVLRY